MWSVFALHVCLSSAWVNVPTVPQGETQTYKLFWTMPSSPTDDSGLGGGIAFAMDPTFCSTVRPYFREDKTEGVAFNPFTWITCAEINDALARAMATWSSNHPYIQFYNVTDECGDTGANCSLVELWITGKVAPAGVEDVAAFVNYLQPNGGWRNGPRTPAGGISLSDWMIERAHLTFYVGGESNVCWFLDNTFCYGIRLLQQSSDALSLFKWIVFSCWAVGYMGVLISVLLFVHRVFVRSGHIVCERASVLRGVSEFVGLLSDHNLLIWLVMLLVWTPPTVWFKVVLPCLQCYDFESAAAHELGHVLGFTHPDTHPQLDRVALSPMGPATCRFAQLSPGSLGSPVKFNPGGAQAQDSLMVAMTTTRGRVCLSDNDLQGLQFLYPVCLEQLVAQAPANCVVSQSYIGWSRIVVNIIPAAAFAAIGLQLLSQISLVLQSRARRQNRWKLAASNPGQIRRPRRLRLVKIGRRWNPRGQASDDAPAAATDEDADQLSGDEAQPPAAGSPSALRARGRSPGRAAADDRPRSRSPFFRGATSRSLSPAVSRSRPRSLSPEAGGRNQIQYDKRAGRYVITLVEPAADRGRVPS